MPPKVVGPYTLLSPLGKGGISTVYRARDRRTNEPVALKLLNTGAAFDATTARRLVREFEALAELNHPSVVKVFDAGVFQGYPYLAMELIEGLDLRSYLSVDLEAPVQARQVTSAELFDAPYELEGEGGTETRARFGIDELLEEPDTDAYGAGSALRAKRALRAYAEQNAEPDTDPGFEPPSEEVEAVTAVEELPAPMVSPPHRGPDLAELNRPERIGRLKDALLQICEALGYIHSHGLVHRDLKPGNIMVDDDRRVKLMDFGLAKFLADEASVTATGRVVGTYRYMAPEQALGERLDGRADLYSLGVLMYELLAGRPPYDGRTPVELWREILEHDPMPLRELNPGVDEVLARVAHKLLRKDPDERFQTAEEIFDFLVAG